jgi:alpha-1,3-glucosyltransferase
MIDRVGVSRILSLSILSKLLTINTKLYFSTDFEVHRNWLAITQSVPFKDWYLEARSPWTLDYPPFFAYFEYLLGLFAGLFDQKIVDINALNNSDWSVLFFQRLSVILVSDLILALGIISVLPKNHQSKGLILGIFSSSLFIIDHIHFQYNGMLLGIFLCAIACVQRERWYLGAALYIILIFFKHVYVYSAPVFFIYFVRHFVALNPVQRFISLASVVLAVSAIALVPIVLTGQLEAMLGRLFPFGRGLVHSYWAPNFWALYVSADRIFGWVFRISSVSGSPTAGLVGETVLLVLPHISPAVCMAVTLIAYIPILWLVWKDKNRRVPFTVWTAMGNATAFAFGWHIHEKALLMVLLPLIVASITDGRYSQIVWRLSANSCASQLPLLPRPQETILKWVIAMTGSLADAEFSDSEIEPSWLMLVFGSEVYRVVFHNLIFGADRMQFFPLLLTSLSNSLAFFTVMGQLYFTVYRTVIPGQVSAKKKRN